MSNFFIPLVVFLVAASGSFITERGMEWYATLVQPDITPPGGVIGAVWTVLYVLAAISAIRFWKRRKRDPRFRLTASVFVLNALLNFGWSATFFGLHQVGAAIFVAAALAASVAWLIVLLKPVDRPASLLLIPYLLWSVFATYLNYAVWKVN